MNCLKKYKYLRFGLNYFGNMAQKVCMYVHTYIYIYMTSSHCENRKGRYLNQILLGHLVHCMCQVINVVGCHACHRNATVLRQVN